MAVVDMRIKQTPDLQCSWCKRVCWYAFMRSAPEAWHHIPEDADLGEISHGICPECEAAWRKQFGLPARTATGEPGNTAAGPRLSSPGHLDDDAAWRDARRAEAATIDAAENDAATKGGE